MTSLKTLIDNDILQIIPYKKQFKIEAQYIIKYYNASIINIYFIDINIYNNEDMINKEIIKSYNTKPDIIIIGLNNDINVDVIPSYPILYKNVYYITPIQLEQINGYTTNIQERICNYLGAILSTKTFKYNNIKEINIYDDNLYGLSTYRTGIEKNACVHNIKGWMTKNITKKIIGWMTNKNKLAINYIFKYYVINNIVELGSYLGKSTTYMALQKNNMNIYCFDNFTNVMLKNSTITDISPIDINYFLKYLRYETFNANLNFYTSSTNNMLNNNNIYAIKYDNFNAINLLQANKINNIDLFYIDFCKISKQIIILVNKILTLYPNSIIIGDDARMLKNAIIYFEKKYKNFINLGDCYICTKRKLIYKNDIINIYNTIIHNETTMDEKYISTLNMEYKTNYIMRLITLKKNINVIIKNIYDLNIDLNNYSEYIGGNLYHYICKMQLNPIYTSYCNELYNIMINIQEDKQIQNNYGIIPYDYIKYNITFT